ncbi:hypothetical protein DK128_04640 [Vibrio cholerae O1 biovar El Tor]|nr:hypothetical protein [Vibrio cholerae O1 biovar El Tor]
MNSSGFFMLEPHLELRYPMRKLTTTDTHHAGIPRQNYRTLTPRASFSPLAFCAAARRSL